MSFKWSDIMSAQDYEDYEEDMHELDLMEVDDE